MLDARRRTRGGGWRGAGAELARQHQRLEGTVALQQHSVGIDGMHPGVAGHAFTDNVLISTPACVLFAFTAAVFARVEQPCPE